MILILLTPSFILLLLYYTSYDNLKLFWREYKTDGLLKCFEKQYTPVFNLACLHESSLGFMKKGCDKVCAAYDRMNDPSGWIWEGKKPDETDYKHAINDFVDRVEVSIHQ